MKMITLIDRLFAKFGYFSVRSSKAFIKIEKEEPKIFDYVLSQRVEPMSKLNIFPDIQSFQLALERKMKYALLEQAMNAIEVTRKINPNEIEMRLRVVVPHTKEVNKEKQQ